MASDIISALIAGKQLKQDRERLEESKADNKLRRELMQHQIKQAGLQEQLQDRAIQASEFSMLSGLTQPQIENLPESQLNPEELLAGPTRPGEDLGGFPRKQAPFEFEGISGREGFSLTPQSFADTLAQQRQQQASDRLSERRVLGPGDIEITGDVETARGAARWQPIPEGGSLLNTATEEIIQGSSRRREYVIGNSSDGGQIRAFLTDNQRTAYGNISVRGPRSASEEDLDEVSSAIIEDGAPPIFDMRTPNGIALMAELRRRGYDARRGVLDWESQRTFARTQNAPSTIETLRAANEINAKIADIRDLNNLRNNTGSRILSSFLNNFNLTGFDSGMRAEAVALRDSLASLQTDIARLRSGGSGPTQVNLDRVIASLNRGTKAELDAALTRAENDTRYIVSAIRDIGTQFSDQQEEGSGEETGGVEFIGPDGQILVAPSQEAAEEFMRILRGEAP
jgi:hypothetical protein